MLFYFFDNFDDFLERLGGEFFGENHLVLVEEEDLRCGDDVVNLVPVDIGLAAVDVDPIEAVFVDEIVPFGAGFLIGFAEDGEGRYVAAVFVFGVAFVKVGDSCFAVAASGRPEDEKRVFAFEGIKALEIAVDVFHDELRGGFADEDFFPCVGALHVFVDGGGRHPVAHAGFDIFLDHVDVDGVVAHNGALEVFFGDGVNQVAEVFFGGFGFFDEFVDIFDDGFGGSVLEAFVEVVDQSLMENHVRGADKRVVVEFGSRRNDP